MRIRVALRKHFSAIAMGFVIIIAVVATATWVASRGPRGAISNFALDTNDAGHIVVSWEMADPEPSDCRVRWAPNNQDYPNSTDSDRSDRTNGYVDGRYTGYVIVNLPVDQMYKVQMRARYNKGKYAHKMWSGPWVEGSIFLRESSGDTPNPDSGFTPDPDP